MTVSLKESLSKQTLEHLSIFGRNSDGIASPILYRHSQRCTNLQRLTYQEVETSSSIPMRYVCSRVAAMNTLKQLANSAMNNDNAQLFNKWSRTALWDMREYAASQQIIYNSKLCTFRENLISLSSGESSANGVNHYPYSVSSSYNPTTMLTEIIVERDGVTRRISIPNEHIIRYKNIIEDSIERCKRNIEITLENRATIPLAY